MQPQDFARAAAALTAGAAQVAVPGFPGGLGPGMAALARLAAGCDRVFLARPPGAPGAVICGASHAPAPGIRAHAAGIGPTPQAAFARAMGEVAEGRALYRQPDDPRLDVDGTVPLLDHRLAPRGRIPARGLLRDGTGAVPGSGLGAGPDIGMAARSAWHEVVERDAIARWFAGDAPATPLPAPGPARAVEAALRRATPLRYLLLPSRVAGLVTVAALSDGDGGSVPGYGCAPDPAEAACKAATEVVQGEFALHLEWLAQAESGVPPGPHGFTARAAMLAGRPDLIHPAPGAMPAPDAPATPRHAVLTLPGDGVHVLRAMATGFLHPTGMPGPV
ncbi:YcaO-like family protein [Gemmobacter sp.]|uniref:YcaO-like family protein n=1 Tax=Gemmobacter sp. TaxID=1898957 RepID=UPI002AFFD80B|nr:YcaO-like family protein [Gemmobacter sp.]